MSREKPVGPKERTSNKLNPCMASMLGFEPGPHWWEASVLTTVPPSHPCIFNFNVHYLSHVIVNIMFSPGFSESFEVDD